MLKLTPFSFWRLPTGTTMLELVVSGRSVAMASFALGQLSARAEPVPRRMMHAKPNGALRLGWRMLLCSRKRERGG
jgi:hypothetical protein